MKKILLVLLSFALFMPAYSQIVENPSFEEWETENGKAEPVNWSSVQTAVPQNIANMAPQVMKRSDDAHTGESSVKLENLGAFGIVATGTVTNGRLYANLDRAKAYAFTDPTDDRWNTKTTARPDSVVGWYKFQPPASGTDFPTVKVLLHKDTAKLPDPDSTNFIGININPNLPSTPQTTWKRFSFPIYYRNDEKPEHVLFVITSGNGVDAVKGSVAWFDDIELVFKSTAVDEEDMSLLVDVRGGNGKITASLTRFAMGNKFNVRVFNLVGEEVYRNTVNTGERTEITNLHPGVYFCVFTSDDGKIISRKVLVQ